jgi:VanZ family protein
MRHHSTARPLALAMVMLVVYASLYPFEGWRWPAGMDIGAVMRLPWPRWHDAFDDIANVAGYVPLSALIYGAVVRGGGQRRLAMAAAVAWPAGLSYSVEVLQTFLPARVPSFVTSRAMSPAAPWARSWPLRWMPGAGSRHGTSDACVGSCLRARWP